MMTHRFEKYVSFALCATGVVLCCLSGCRKEAEVPSSAPESYMKDTNFLHQVSDKRKELQAIANERLPLVRRMEELIKEHGEDLAKLQKIDEWNGLHQKVVELNAKYQEVRKRQLKLVGERIAPPKKGISK